MRAAPIDDAFFMGSALLLVEDPLTAVVLRECWSGDPRSRKIAVRAVGGRESAERLVQAAREEGRSTVFGFVDRDFGEPRTGPVVFSTDRHEIENELLDTLVIAALSSKAPTEIDQVLSKAAQSLTEWMGVRYLLQARKQLRPSFPADPTRSDASLSWVDTAARSYCDEVKRYSQAEIPSAWRDTFQRTYLPRAQRESGDGSWRDHFSGKELFAALVSRLSGSGFVGTLEDRARVIAARWRKHPEVSPPPECLTRARDEIIAQCGL